MIRRPKTTISGSHKERESNPLHAARQPVGQPTTVQSNCRAAKPFISLDKEADEINHLTPTEILDVLI
uniref:SFRICE_037724 n=1 Tax=Spodoptera frugiperda TaxID=7108 RepID=A0A2H1WQN8_SPOFR